MSERMKPTDVLKDPNFRKLNLHEEEELVKAYQRDLLAGLKGEPTSLAMFPSCLDPIELSLIPKEKTALVIEMGGTNAYGAHVVFDQQGKPSLGARDQNPLGRVVYESTDDFFHTVVSCLDQKLFTDQVPDALAIVYSFPAQATKTLSGVDVKSPEQLTKEFVIPEISRGLVGEKFVSYLSRHFQFPQDLPRAVLNDTVAVAFSNGSKLGGVVASGFNLAVTTPEGVVNTESGGFSGIPSYKLIEEIDQVSDNPGHQLAEKQISGAYLGRQCARILELLKKTGTDLPPLPQNITSEYISAVLQQGVEGEIFRHAQTLRDRSAQLVGIMIGTCIKTFPDIFTEEKVGVPIEGSLFWKMPGYVSAAKEVTERVAGKQVEFQNIPDAGRVGAGIAALSMLAKK